MRAAEIGASRPLTGALLPIAATVFATFFVIGLAMPVLPLHVHDSLGQGTFVVGLIAGSQFAVSLVSRFGAGRFADARGGKRSILLGLIIAALAGAIYVASMYVIDKPGLSAAILIIGRGVLGGAESFIVTGALGWGLALGGPSNAGRVIAWMGMPMYAAFALGAPLGSLLYAAYGFNGIGMATLVVPLASISFIARVTPVIPPRSQGAPVTSVLGAVRLPGLGLALSSLGFGAVTIFVSLLFAAVGWRDAWGAFTALSVAFILARLVLGHLPDQIGGRRTALISIVVEAVGVLTIWASPSAGWAFFGAAITGLGYSLVFPALGVEAIRRAPPESRALTMGAYTACLDLALGAAGPGLGALAQMLGVRAIFLAAAGLVLMGAIVPLLLSRTSAR